MRAAKAGAVVLCLVASGCLGPAHPDLEKIPGDQSREPAPLAGDPLILYRFFTPHGDPETGYLAPNATDPAATPAACAFYWQGRTQRSAACAVEGAKHVREYTHDGGHERVPWTLRFQTDRNPDTWGANASVVAYASDGTVVAWWTGARAPNVAHLTE